MGTEESRVKHPVELQLAYLEEYGHHLDVPTAKAMLEGVLCPLADVVVVVPLTRRFRAATLTDLVVMTTEEGLPARALGALRMKHEAWKWDHYAVDNITSYITKHGEPPR